MKPLILVWATAHGINTVPGAAAQLLAGGCQQSLVFAILRSETAALVVAEPFAFASRSPTLLSSMNGSRKLRQPIC